MAPVADAPQIMADEASRLANTTVARIVEAKGELDEGRASCLGCCPYDRTGTEDRHRYCGRCQEVQQDGRHCPPVVQHTGYGMVATNKNLEEERYLTLGGVLQDRINENDVQKTSDRRPTDVQWTANGRSNGRPMEV